MNGAHDNLMNLQPLTEIPDGWAIIPDDMEVPDTFPFVDITVQGGVVTAMTAGETPEPVPEPVPEPTAQERLEAQVTYTAMMTDTLLEEG